jgi:tetratricopeptide (TPR) repeat protein
MTAPSAGIAARLESFDLGEYAKKNTRTLSILGGAVFIVAAGLWLYVQSARRKEAFAQQALGQARVSAESGNLPLAASDLARLVERFGGTHAADEAVVMLAQVRLVQGQRDVAINDLQRFVRSRHPAYVKASAYGLLGNGLEDAGKLREAGEAYRQAAAAAALDFLKATYLLDAGRALTAAGDTTGARAAYGEVLSKYGLLDQSTEARVRMAEIGGVVPELPADTTN